MTLTALGLIHINGCSESPLAPPMCRYEGDEQVNSDVAQARCVIRIDNRLITIRQHGTNKLTIPGGEKLTDESLQCAAHRHTWQLTGFNVNVKTLLGTTSKNVAYYDCEFDAGFHGDVTQFPVPKPARSDIKEINLQDPFVLSVHDWRSDENLVVVRQFFNQAKEKK